MGAGKPKVIETPEKMWQLFEQYKEDTKINPRQQAVNSKHGIQNIPLERPLTWQGFDIWLRNNGIIHDSKAYRLNVKDGYNEYRTIITRIHDEIYNDKFEGASVGQFNANIIARDLGLVDKRETTKNKPKKTRDEILKRLDELERKKD